MEFTISALYLFSSYFYGYLAALRYSDYTDDFNFYFTLTMVFETIFLIHIFIQFLIDYKVEGKEKPVRDLAKIAINYYNNGLIIDLICIAPF